MTWAKKIEQLGNKHKTANETFKSDFIHAAFDGRLGVGQSNMLAAQIEDVIDYVTDVHGYGGVHRQFYEALAPKNAIDFFDKYMTVSGLVTDRNERKTILDAFQSAEEHVMFNTPVATAMEAFNVEDTEVVGTAATGVSHNQIPEHTRVIDASDAYSDEEIERLSDEQSGS